MTKDGELGHPQTRSVFRILELTAKDTEKTTMRTYFERALEGKGYELVTQDGIKFVRGTPVFECIPFKKSFPNAKKGARYDGRFFVDELCDGRTMFRVELYDPNNAFYDHMEMLISDYEKESLTQSHQPDEESDNVSSFYYAFIRDAPNVASPLCLLNLLSYDNGVEKLSQLSRGNGTVNTLHTTADGAEARPTA